MKIKKKDLVEIIDSNGELIGKEDTPTTGSDLESGANNTTEYNAKIGTQPFRYDMLGRFGFTLMPFMEGKENQGQQELLNELAGLMHQRYAEILEYYYRNPNKLKSDFRKSMEEDHGHDDECEKKDVAWAKKIIKPIEEADIITESNVVEDKLVDKKTEDDISKTTADKEVREKRLEKIAGLINR